MTKWHWHVHHNRLCEPLTAPIEERIAYIKVHKPIEEQAVRLRLLKPVVGEIPAALDKAWSTYYEVWERQQAIISTGATWNHLDEATWNSVDEAWDSVDEAWDSFNEVQGAHQAALEALHKQECPGCPWNGMAIFPI